MVVVVVVASLGLRSEGYWPVRMDASQHFRGTRLVGRENVPCAMGHPGGER
jgi:hypothetical protein